MNNNQSYKVIGVMSGTSVDGIDFSFLETNGTNFVKIISGKSYKYSKGYKTKVKNFIKQFKTDSSLSLTKIDLLVSRKFLYMTKKFINEFNINTSIIDFIGISGQTILHKPDKKISIQLGSGRFLSKYLKINIISNFRKNDIFHGGQGAPIGVTYHKYLLNKFGKKTIIVNIGGIANISYANKYKLIAFDTGPGNALIDDFMWIRKKKYFDESGNLSFKGKLNKLLLDEYLNDKYFKKEYPKSLDREYFNHFIQKTNKLSDVDGVHTLTMMTVYGIKNAIDLIGEKINQIILTGGGRKNLFILNRLKKITNLEIIDIDEMGYDGDLLEAEAFGYLAIRSIKNLPLSINTTTGVKKPLTGGILYKAN